MNYQTNVIKICAETPAHEALTCMHTYKINSCTRVYAHIFMKFFWLFIAFLWSNTAYEWTLNVCLAPGAGLT